MKNLLLLPILLSCVSPSLAMPRMSYEDMQLMKSIISVGIAKCNYLQGYISKEKTAKKLRTDLRKRLSHRKYMSHINYVNSYEGKGFVKDVISSLYSDCVDLDDIKFQKFYKKFALRNK